MKILVCGGAGFIGSNFIRHMLSNYKDIKIINYDKLTYAGNLDNLKDQANDDRYAFIRGDITDEKAVNEAMKNADYVVNFAAETHVDRSIHIGSREFVMTNTVGVQTLLDAARKNSIKKYIQISTDEVYGSLELDEGRKFKEDTPFEPNVPYAAAKAGGDLLCRAYFETFKTPVIVTHCSNNYGPYQYPEKLIPFLTLKALENRQLPIYGDGKNVRDWIHVLDHCKAIDLLIQKGVPGEVYNIGSDNERNNIEIASMILKILDKPKELITFVKDRPGHDRRYAIDAGKIRKLGWKPEYVKENFEEGLRKTIEWYIKNREWSENIKKKSEEFNPHINYGDKHD